MNLKKARLAIGVSGLFLFIDRLLKWLAVSSWAIPRLLNPYLGWQPFFNNGIAFSLPIPRLITLLFTLPIICLICFGLYREFKKANANALLIFSLTLIFTGALSNFIDRMFCGHVIDYLLLGTAVINISDIIIVGGLILYLLNFKNKNSESTN